jgi:transporter family protein
MAGSFPAITTVLSLIFFSEVVGPLQALAIVVTLIGVALSSMQGKVNRLLMDMRSSGAIFAFGAFVCWGVYFAFVRIPIEQIGWFWTQYSGALVGLVLFLIIAKLNKDRSMLVRPKPLWLLVVIALLSVGGSMLFNYAVSKGPTSVVAPIAGSSPAVFVMLAFFIFRERLNKKQWLGIVLAVIGIVALSVLSA